MMTHMCVDTTVKAAKDYGYNITLILDGSTTKDLEWNGDKVSASTVQSVYMASLNQKFATVTLSTEFYSVWREERHMELMMQPIPETCGQACIAMITGKGIEEVIKDMRTGGPPASVSSLKYWIITA